MGSKFDRLRNWYEARFLRVDFVFATSAYATSIAFVAYFYGLAQFSANLSETKATLYASLFSLGGTMLGFLISSISLIVAFGESPRFRLLKDSGHYRNAATVFFDAMKWLGLLTGVAFAAMFFDSRESQSTAFVFVLGFLVLMCAFRTFRCIWILKRLVTIAVVPGEKTERRNAA